MTEILNHINYLRTLYQMNRLNSPSKIWISPDILKELYKEIEIRYQILPLIRERYPSQILGMVIQDESIMNELITETYIIIGE